MIDLIKLTILLTVMWLGAIIVFTIVNVLMVLFWLIFDLPYYVYSRFKGNRRLPL